MERVEMLVICVCTVSLFNDIIVEKMSDCQLDSKEPWQQKQNQQEKLGLR